MFLIFDKPQAAHSLIYSKDSKNKMFFFYLYVMVKYIEYVSTNVCCYDI